MLYELIRMIFPDTKRKSEKKHNYRNLESRAMERYLSKAGDRIDLEHRYKEWDRMNSTQKNIWTK